MWPVGQQVPGGQIMVVQSPRGIPGAVTLPGDTLIPRSIVSCRHCSFSFLPLSRRDLSENFIQAIPRKAFRGATDLKNL